jgi:DAK2 domain fusion protein YloV
MMISGAHNLYNYRQPVNDLNVFPVPDGDTGTNMSMTVTAMAKSLEEVVSASASKVADAMSFATLRGARGNSGVILSQFFRGISKELKGKTKINAEEFANALKKGSDAAYKAVMNPTEGTILTVAREIAQTAVKEAAVNSDISEVFEKALKRGNKVLLKTPDMLPALKKAGVVDAGGQGWIYFLEGALYYIKTGKCIEAIMQDMSPVHEQESTAQKKADTANIKYIYCTEFIIEKSSAEADVLAFRRAIEAKGDSMLVIDDDDIVKVHIHTNNPGYVLERAVKLGSMINIKIDNMKHQHQSLINAEAEKKPEQIFPEKDTAFVAVCAGDGLCEILKSMGIDYIIEGGQTMNPSTEDILDAVKKVNAKNVFVFPNNKNIILAAEQAKKLAENNVIVLQSKNIPQCISAMIEYNQDKSAEDNERKMSSAMQNVAVGQVTYAVRDTQMDGIDIKEGDVIGIAGGKIEVTGKAADDVCKSLIEKVSDDDSEYLNIYYGEGISKEEAEEIEACIENDFPDLEVSVKYGGQPLYYYIISAE